MKIYKFSADSYMELKDKVAEFTGWTGVGESITTNDDVWGYSDDLEYQIQECEEYKTLEDGAYQVYMQGEITYEIIYDGEGDSDCDIQMEAEYISFMKVH